MFVNLFAPIGTTMNQSKVMRHLLNGSLLTVTQQQQCSVTLQSSADPRQWCPPALLPDPVPFCLLHSEAAFNFSQGRGYWWLEMDEAVGEDGDVPDPEEVKVAKERVTEAGTESTTAAVANEANGDATDLPAEL